MKTEGFDISLNYLTPMTSTGRFGFGIDGTYVSKLDYRDSKVSHGQDRLAYMKTLLLSDGNTQLILTGHMKIGD